MRQLAAVLLVVTIAAPIDAIGQTATPGARAVPCRVFVTETKVNPTWYEKVKEVKYSKRWYGSSEPAFRSLAKQAWDLDADAVVAVDVRFHPTFWSWASPHANGIAVKWTDRGQEGFPSLEGRCFDREAQSITTKVAKPEPTKAPTTTTVSTAPTKTEARKASEPKTPFPWDAVVAAAIVGGTAFAIAKSGGSDSSTGSSGINLGSGYAAAAMMAGAAPTPASVLPSTQWIASISSRGDVIVLSDNTVWIVNWRDQIRASLWLPTQRVALVRGSRFNEFLIVRTDRADTIRVEQVR